jgi:diguanylate cyclase
MAREIVSIRNSIEELGALEDRLRAAVTAYTQAFKDVEEQIFRLYPSKLGLPMPSFSEPRKALSGEPGLDAIRKARAAFGSQITATGFDFESRLASLVDLGDVLERIGKLNERLRGGAGRQDQRLEAVKSGLQGALGICNVDEMRRTLTGQVAALESAIEHLRAENKEMLGEMEASMAAYRRQLDEAKAHAVEDPVTGLPNRRRLDSEVQAFFGSGVRFSLILLCVHQFKVVNEKHGHKAGDELLRQFGQRLRAQCRVEEKAAHWRGAEFALLVVGGLSEAIVRSRPLERELTGEYSVPGAHGPIRVYVTVRFGIAESRDRDSREDLFARAESLLKGAS